MVATFSPPKNQIRLSNQSGIFLSSNGELSGQEGEKLIDIINKVSTSIQETESTKRLIQSIRDADQKRKQCKDNLEFYIDSLRLEAKSTNESEFSVSVIDKSLHVWQELSKGFTQKGFWLEVPNACPGQNNDFMYTWSKDMHYLECEIFGNGAVEFFYRNRESGDIWGEDTTFERGFSAAIFEKVALFSR